MWGYSTRTTKIKGYSARITKKTQLMGFIAQEVLIKEHLRIIVQEGQIVKLFKG